MVTSYNLNRLFWQVISPGTENIQYPAWRKRIRLSTATFRTLTILMGCRWNIQTRALGAYNHDLIYMLKQSTHMSNQPHTPTPPNVLERSYINSPPSHIALLHRTSTFPRTSPSPSPLPPTPITCHPSHPFSCQPSGPRRDATTPFSLSAIIPTLHSYKHYVSSHQTPPKPYQTHPLECPPNQSIVS